jgi:serine/threonine protein kinase
MATDNDPIQLIGRTVDEKYKIVSLAGQGGFSAVYRAEHLVWNEPVAIKFFTVLRDAKAELREKLLNDFVQEGKLMTQLSSRSAAIVQARDIGRLQLDGDTWLPYMVLEWLDGEPLGDTLSRERREGFPPRTLAEAVALLDPVAQALDVAHQQNVAHRDLKPDNIIILGDPREAGVAVKVLDFGIAKVMAEHAELQDQLKLTGQQITSFTPRYGAPEQFSRSFGATGPWTDVFAMALIVTELIIGRRALQGNTPFDLGAASCHKTVRPTPANLGFQVPPEAEAVFAKAVTLAVADRYPSMGAFWKELHAVADPNASTWQLSTAATQLPGAALDAAQIDGAQQGSTIGGTAETITRQSRSRAPVIALAAAAIAIVGAGAAYLSQSGGSSAANVTAAADKGATIASSASASTSSIAASTERAAVLSEDDSESDVGAAASASASEKSSSPPRKTRAKRRRARDKPKPAADKPAPAKPAPAKPAPAKPAADKLVPKAKTGSDAWDPSNFGNR